MSDLLVRNGIVVFPEWGPMRVDLRARGGRVAEIGEQLGSVDGETVLDASDRYVFPGFIDPHVHLGNYNPFVEDIATETMAAAAGGVTTLLTFVKVLRHRSSQVSYREVLPEVVQQIRDLASIDVGIHLALSTQQHVDEIAEYEALGCRSFKFYIGYKASPQALKRGSVGVTDGFILEAMRVISAAGGGGKALIHCENEDICETYLARVKEPEKASWLEWASTRPNVAEAESVQRGCFLAREADCPLYVVHLSCKESLAMAREARRKTSQPIYVEVNVHHLLLNREQANTVPVPSHVKVNPPIRDQASVDALWRGLADGSVDTVGTDHCAIKMERKQGGIVAADPGFPSLDFFTPLLLTEATRRGIPLERMAQVCALNSARIFRLQGKGTLRPGSDADIIVVNLNAPWTINATKSLSASRFSPYDGMKVTAKVETVALRGEVVLRDGRMVRERLGRPLTGS